MADLQGRTIVVTGATSGIGLEASVELARRGASLLLVGRSPERLAGAVAQVRRRGADREVRTAICDMGSLASVRALGAELGRLERIDVLVNNAGGVSAAREVTADGLERTFAVNHLAPFLLTHLLLDRLRASAPSRIVNVASRVHYRGTLDFDDLQFRQGYGVLQAYARSKLCNVLFTAELARRLEGSGVTANCLHPGAVATRIWARAPAWSKPILAVAKLFMLSPEDGGATIVHAAASAELQGKSGLYLEKNRPVKPARLARDPEAARRLWDVSAALAGLSPSP